MYDEGLAERAAGLLGRVRTRRPLIHHITNVVTMNDVANVTLVLGALPVMAPSSLEAEEMAGHADGVVLNLGTPDADRLEAMVIAGRRAAERGKPVVLDPVGVGTTTLRTDGARRLLAEVMVRVVRGNRGEIGRLAGLGGEVRGVESGAAPDPVTATARIAAQLDLVAAATGERDFVTDRRGTLVVDNGHPLMGAVVGTGCMATAVVGCFAAVADDYRLATAAALACFGIAGELAAADSGGPGSFRMALIDRLYALTPEMMADRARITTLEEALRAEAEG